MGAKGAAGILHRGAKDIEQKQQGNEIKFEYIWKEYLIWIFVNIFAILNF